MEPETNGDETTNTVDPTEATSDMSKYRIFAILGYIIPFLFFLPLLNEKTKSVPYVRFHANQQLNLFILFVILDVATMFLVISMAIFVDRSVELGLYLGRILILILQVIGIVNAYKGKKNKLPLVGYLNILK